MGNLLLDNQKTDIRFQNADLILYEPTEIQYEEIVKILQESSKVGGDLSVEGEIPSNHIRYVIRELSSIGHEIDDMTDEEILSALDNGNRKLKTLFKEMLNLLEEITEDIQWGELQQIKTMNTFINAMNSKDSADKIKIKMEKLLKKNGLDMTLEELVDIQNNPEKINELVNKIKAKPQDHKKKVNKTKK